MNTTFEIKKREDLSPADQGVFDGSVKQLGFFPNMYGIIANSHTALSKMVKAEFSPSSLSAKEGEIVNLVTSQVNGCSYCLGFHNSYLGKLGVLADHIMEMRTGSASFDPKLDALVKLTKSLVENRGHIDGILIDNLIAAGYTKETVIDVIFLINLRGITNYVHEALGGFEMDFPEAPPIN